MSRMIKAITCTVLGLCSSLQAQVDHDWCGTEGRPARNAAQRSAFGSTSCTSVVTAEYLLPWHVPVKAHIVRNSDGTGGWGESELSVVFKEWNDTLSDSGLDMLVFRYGTIDYIDDDFWTNLAGRICDGGSNDMATCTVDADCPGGTCRSKGAVLKGVNNLSGTLNAYFVPNHGSLCGSGNFTDAEYHGIAVSNAGNCNSPGKIAAHELGHFMDLRHTHEDCGGSCRECPEGDGCGTDGDDICDTPADPGLGSGNVLEDACVGGSDDGLACDDDSDCSSGACVQVCAYIGSDSPPGSCDGTPYDPDVGNLMSYAPRDCKDHFSSDQRDCAFDAWVDYRQDLFDRTRYVDEPTGSALNDGSATDPLDAIEDAIDSSGAEYVFIRSGTYDAPMVITESIHLHCWDASGGGVVIK